MDSGVLERVKEVLDGVLRCAAEERAAFLAETCEDETTVRREVESLLRQEDVETPLLDGPIGALTCARRNGNGSEAVTPPIPGDRVGAYQVVELLGEGGMGTVVKAVREDDFRKQVALKLIRPDFVSEELERRFHEERQILANLDHPNIARILDGGTTREGRPYFAMEYVEGLPIDEHCRRHRLPVGERLELFREVCAAISAAHRNLVVHRDLKPSNILIDQEGTVKLLDFGIAKRLEMDSGPPLTRLGLVPMTLRYASPEQIAGRPVTTASDVYSLGVVLYEILTGRSPYPADTDSDVAMARAVCEQEPTRPSSAVVRGTGSSGAGAEAPDRAAAQGGRCLQRRLAGDLDSIVLKALRKDPSKRYGSVDQMSDDVRRHLEGLPITAREGTFSYLAGKFVRRHKLPLAAIALVLLTFGLAGTSTIFWRQAERERALKNEVVDLIDSLALWATIDVASGVDLDAVRVLGSIEKIFERLELACEARAEVLESLGLIAIGRGRYREALGPLQKTLEIRRELAKEDPSKLARTVNNLAGAHLRLEEFQQAESHYREALDLKREFNVRDGQLAKGVSNLATALAKQGRLEEAERYYREALGMRREIYGPRDADIATSLRNLGNLLYLRGDLEGAETALQEALSIRRSIFGPDHRSVATVLCSLGRVFHAQGRFEKARENLSECLEIRENTLDEVHPHTAYARRDLASVLIDAGELETAESLLNEALAVLREAEDVGGWQLAETESVLGVLLAARGKHAKAEALLTRSYEAISKARGEDIYTRKARQRLRQLPRSSE